MDWGKTLFDPNGRIGQQPFWIGVLVILAGNVLVNVLPVIGFFLWIALIWVGISVYGKRLHDAGKTAWLVAIPWAISIGLFIVGLVLFGMSLLNLIIDAMQNDEPSTESIVSIITASGGLLLMLFLGTLVWLGFTLWVGLLKSDPGANEYGPAPAIEGRASSASTGDAPGGGH